MSLFNKAPSYKQVVLFVSNLDGAEHKKFISVVNAQRKANRLIKSILNSPLDKYKLDYEPYGEPGKIQIDKAEKPKAKGAGK